MGGMGGAQAPMSDMEQKRRQYVAPQVRPTGPQQRIVEVRVEGNQAISADRIRQSLKTRKGFVFDKATVRTDVRRLTTTGLFRNVQPFFQPVDQGMIVTFQVQERPLIGYVRFTGNKAVGEKKLLKKAELKVGEPLNRYRLEEAKRRIEEHYVERGNTGTTVQIIEGLSVNDKGATFQVTEGVRQRVRAAKFVGNTVVGSDKLRTIVKTKPGILWVFKGKVNEDVIDADVERLTKWYRNLGFFKASISRELQFDKTNTWLTITFVIDEGPRYGVRQVIVKGNQQFTTESMMQNLTLKDGDVFDMRKMNSDVTTMRNAYGGEGYIYAEIKPQLNFFEEPGQLDIVYDISEGEQWIANRVIVNINGEHPHTRRNVILNRVSIAPGQTIDIREIQNSKRRLEASQLFETNPAQGAAPRIVVRPLNADGQSMAERDVTRNTRFRGQTPKY